MESLGCSGAIKKARAYTRHMNEPSEKAYIVETFVLAYIIVVLYQQTEGTPLGEALFMGIWLSIPTSILLAGLRELISIFFKK